MLTFLGGLQIGPFSIPYSWLGVLLGILTASWAMKRGAKRWDMPDHEPITDSLVTVAWVWLLGWKFSALVLAPGSVLSDPLVLLLPAAFSDAWMAGAGAALLYALWVWRKRKPVLADVVDLGVFGLVAGYAVASLFRLQLGRPTDWPWGIPADGSAFQPVNFYEAAALAAVWIVAWRQPAKPAGARGAYLLLLAGGATLFVTLSASYSTVFLELGPMQWVAVIASLLGGSGLYRYGGRVV